LQSIIDKCRICGTEGEQLNTSFLLAPVWLKANMYKKRHDIFAKIIHMNLAVKFNLLKDTQPHYSINEKVVWKMTITNYILIEQSFN
jgi:hypothetical protein